MDSLQILLSTYSRSADVEGKYCSHSNSNFGCYGDAFIKVHGICKLQLSHGWYDVYIGPSSGQYIIPAMR